MYDKLIEINELSIGYKAKTNNKIVAENLTASIKKGELTCLIGSNGIGKSTLLRTLAGFQSPLSGKINICGKEAQSYSNKDLSKLIGVVLTEKVEAGNMSVSELVATGRSPYTGFWGQLNSEDKKIVEKAIDLVNIKILSDRPTYTLSDGERQKTMIAKVLAQETPVIFLDEPTAFLDFPSKVEIMRLLYKLTKTSNKTVFLSTHDLELALQIADKIWILDKQKQLSIGKPDELIQNGLIEKHFQGEGIQFDRTNKLFRIEKQII